MSNEGDEANNYVDNAYAAFEKKVANRANATKLSSEYCIDCDAYIPQARQEATGGAMRCTTCEDSYSKMKGWYR